MKTRKPSSSDVRVLSDYLNTGNRTPRERAAFRLGLTIGVEIATEGYEITDDEWNEWSAQLDAWLRTDLDRNSDWPPKPQPPEAAGDDGPAGEGYNRPATPRDPGGDGLPIVESDF